MRIAYHQIDGIETRVLDGGEGAPPVLLIHPVGYSADIWCRNIGDLAQYRHVVAPDLIGHGFTGFRDVGNDAPQAMFIRQLTALADHFCWDRFSIIGSSLGSQLAALFSLEMPDRVDRLVLIGSGSTFSTEDEVDEALSRVMANGLTAIANPTLESCRVRVRNTCHELKDLPEEIFLAQMSSYARPGMAAMYRQILEGMMNRERVRPFRVYERLEEIDVPTLIVSGHDDTRAPFHRAVEASERIPRASLVGFAECGHLPFLEHPERFNSVVRTFLCAHDDEL